MFRKSFSARHGSQRRASGGSGRFHHAPRRSNRFGARSKAIDFSQFVRKAIRTEETTPYNPQHRFVDFAIHERLKNNITTRNYVHPTPIQDGAIAHILDGRDLIGLANTGTGKTAAFLIPLIDRAFKKKANRVLIVVPTRELALQIETEFHEFSRGFGLRSALCIGGADMYRQIRALRAHPSFVIGTPGRLKDLVERKVLNLSSFNHVVLDEVDRMLDMGFVHDIRLLVSLMMPERQSLFFSATMPREIAELANQFLRDPIRVEVKTRATAENVDQDIVRLKPGEDKMERLHQLLLEPSFTKTLIFGRTKRGVERLAVNLVQRGFKADSIHGDKSQGKRQRALRDFRDGQIAILVATDVAARGLDIPHVTHVINYDIPENYDDYIHRIGRTGRGKNSGTALTFVE